MDGIKTMDSLPSFRANKALVKTINLKAGKLKTSRVSVTKGFERSLPSPQQMEPDMIDMMKTLITYIN